MTKTSHHHPNTLFLSSSTTIHNPHPTYNPPKYPNQLYAYPNITL
jgi:hypothetical protein